MRVWEWIAVAAIGLVFAPALVSMSEIWSRLDYYSHGYLVPLVAIWAASAKRRILPALPARRDARGLCLLLLALGVHAFGSLADLPWAQGLGLVLGVAGGVLWLRGPAWLRALVFPIGYLLFMIPLPEAVLTPVILKLQLFVSEVGVALLQAVGVPVFRDGNVIELPGGAELFVAEACSGITSVVTLLPLGVFLAYFTERSLERRAVIVAAVVPLAMLGNLLRVIVTVLVARRFGVETATGGALHDSTGLMTYVLGCLALLAVGWLMRTLAPEGRSPLPSS